MSDAVSATGPATPEGGALSPSVLLQRISGTLRHDVGPAVGDEYTRTQAFMASVILERVSRQVALAPDHMAAEAADMAELMPQLERVLVDAPIEVSDAFAAVGSGSGSGGVDRLGPLIEALYGWGSEESAVGEALALIRPVLRRDIDRRMEIAT